MSVEVWAKALTAMEAGAAPSIPTAGYAAAICDALSLPWQQHPVWLMHLNDTQLLAVNQQLAQANWALERRIQALEAAAAEEAVPHANDTTLGQQRTG